MEIRAYSETDTEMIFDMMVEEGPEWTYAADGEREKYKIALQNSITYLLFEDEILCGYVRCKNDDGFGIYVLDLLVRKDYRGREFGRKLMKTVYDHFPDDIVYVTSDADIYYEKLGCEKEGSVFRVILE